MNWYWNYQAIFHQGYGLGLWWLLLGPLAIWELAWKGWALWRAAERREVGWFVVLLLINSLGLLPIIYLYVVTNAKRYDRARIK